jgi:hypothetical protein
MKDLYYNLTLTEDRFLRADAAERFASIIADKIREDPDKYKQGIFIKSEYCPVDNCKSSLISLLKNNKEISLNLLEQSTNDNEICFDLDEFTKNYILTLNMT